MFFTSAILCFIFVNFNLALSRKIIFNEDPKTSTTPAPPHEKIDNSLKNNANHDVMNQLHQMYRSEVQNKDADLHNLLVLKQQYIARNYIEEFEIDLALDFTPDWSKVDRWSSTARQGIEIRRQKWEYIFKIHSPYVQSLTAELAKSGLNQSIFCREIAEAYFILSHNSYVYSKGPAPNEKGHRVNEIMRDAEMDKSLKIFMRTLPDSDFKFNDTEELIKIPKSVYHKLLRKDVQMSLLKKHHQSENALNQKGTHHHLRSHSAEDHEHDRNTSHSVTTHQPRDSETPAQNSTMTSSTSECVDSVLDSSSSVDSNYSDDSDDDSDDTSEDSDYNWNSDCSSS